MNKTFHKNVISDLLEFKNKAFIDWNESNQQAAKEWNDKHPDSKESFENYYKESTIYIDAMSAYNKTGKKLRLIEKIAKIIKTLPEVKTIVDFGCGVLSDCLELNELGYKVTGVDLGGQALDFARFRLAKHKINTIDLIEIDEKTKIPHSDLLLSLDTLEHVFNPFETIEQFVEANPKYILMTTAFGVHETDEHTIPHHTDYSINKLEKYLESKGYTKIKLKMPFPPRLFKRNK